jgi:hypothetical protein
VEGPKDPLISTVRLIIPLNEHTIQFNITR